MANDEEREFRLRPRKPAARSEHAVWASAYKTIMRYARMTSRHRRSAPKGCYRSRPHFQRCAVRVIYTKNRTAGQWRTHGRYLVRESVAFDGDAKGLGFDEKGESVEVAERLQNVATGGG